MKNLEGVTKDFVLHWWNSRGAFLLVIDPLSFYPFPTPQDVVLRNTKFKEIAA